jgi:hypothetical protein
MKQTAETAMELSKMIMEAALPCFANNYFIAFVLNSNGKSYPPKSKLKQGDNPLLIIIHLSFSKMNQVTTSKKTNIKI